LIVIRGIENEVGGNQDENLLLNGDILVEEGGRTHATERKIPCFPSLPARYQ